jgi:sec-independent protein translocase protein TatC
MLVIFGVSFELPLLMVFLNVIGVLPRRLVAKHRRMIIFIMFLFAGIATPSTDPFSMVALAIPMVVLFALAEGFMYLRERRLPKDEDFSHLDDDEASPLREEENSLEDEASSIEPVTPVDDASAIDSRTTDPDPNK